MERITISVDEKLAKEFDAPINKRGYTSRSEAMRDLLRRDVEANRVAYERKSYCVANLSYIYDHRSHDLAGRLMAAQHEHHDMVVSTMHVHLDHEHCPWRWVASRRPSSRFPRSMHGPRDAKCSSASPSWLAS